MQSSSISFYKLSALSAVNVHQQGTLAWGAKQSDNTVNCNQRDLPMTCFMKGERERKRGSTPLRKPPRIMTAVAAATMLFWGAMATEAQ